MTFLRRLEKADVAIIAVLAAVTLLIYAQTARFDFVNYDDDFYVYNNPHVAGLTWQGLAWAFTHSHASNWHPLTWMSHMLDVDLFGVTPGGPHMVNVLLHAINAALLYVVLLRLSSERWLAVICAAAFAWHPLRVESVAWIAERKDVLSGLFFMLTLLAYERYTRAPVVGRYLVALAVFALGLMTKPMLVTVPFVLLLLDFWPRRRNVIVAILEKLPMVLLAAVAGTVTLLVQHSGRSVSSLSFLPVAQRVANAVVGYATYLAQVFWPAGLSAFYPHPYLESGPGLPAALVWTTAGGLAAGSIVALLLFRRAPWIAVGWFWYIVMLLPVIGLVQVGRQSHADRYTYLPTIGIALIVIWSIERVTRGWLMARRVAIGAAVVGLSGLAAAAFFQTGHWRDSRSLWEHAIRVNPKNYLALNNLGQAMASAGDNGAAVDLFRRSLAIAPDFPAALTNLAVQFVARGDDRAAKPLLERSLTRNPWQLDAYCTLGGIYVREGRLDAALLMYAQSVDRDPTFVDGHYNMAVTLAQKGEYEGAIERFNRVLALDPADADAARGLQAAQAFLKRRPATTQNNSTPTPN